jgi:hypothetical protein
MGTGSIVGFGIFVDDEEVFCNLAMMEDARKKGYEDDQVSKLPPAFLPAEYESPFAPLIGLPEVGPVA